MFIKCTSALSIRVIKRFLRFHSQDNEANDDANCVLCRTNYEYLHSLRTSASKLQLFYLLLVHINISALESTLDDLFQYK